MINKIYATVLLTLCFPLLTYAVEPSMIINNVLNALKEYNPYKVIIEVSYENNSTHGFYEVDGSSYYISVDQQELYGDETVKYEVFNGRKEVVIDNVSPIYTGNLLSNPATAFSSIGDHYTPSLIASNKSVTVIELKPNIDNDNSQESIELSVSNETMLPTLIIYKFGDQSVIINIIDIAKLNSTITSYDRGKYADYEIIDFR